MRIKLPIQNLCGDCFEAVLINIALYLNRRYEFMYLNEWGFRFELAHNNTNQCLGKALDIYRDKVGPLMKYHGIGYSQHKCENIENLQDILQNNILDKLPIAARIDSYFCSWDKSFNKYHNSNHIVLLNGFDGNSRHIICSDPFYQEWNRMISLEKFADIYTGQYGIFDIKEDISSFVDGLCIFRKTLESLCDENIFDTIKKFAVEVYRADFIKELEPDSEVWFAQIYRRMIDIVNSRKRLPFLITFLSKKYNRPELLGVLPLLEEIIENWQWSKNMTLKLLMNGNMALQEKLSFKINNIADMEKSAVMNLLNI
ncbi:MAG: hypothetical protein E7388_02840 [Ruminococcaceae bacterium]|nr:hypothetical protein [Oscillospiraceae bacterium]